MAIKRFRLTVRLLERFQPRPDMWAKADTSLKKAEQIIKRIRTELYQDMRIKLQLKELPEALVKVKLLLNYYEPGSKNYQYFRNQKIELERLLNDNKRGR